MAIRANDIVKRVPEVGAGDIRLGSQLIVRPSQAAVFFRDGKALDTFTEGRHTLTTANLPLLSSLIGLVTDSRNPFPAEVLRRHQRVRGYEVGHAQRDYRA